MAPFRCVPIFLSPPIMLTHYAENADARAFC